MLTRYQLKQYAIKFLNETYEMDLVVPLELNGRLKTTCGRFVSTRYRDGRKEPKIVEMNKFFVNNNEPAIVLDVLRHELVHYALFMQGKPHNDGSPTFEKELKRLGIISQSTINKYNIISKPRTVSIYECVECGKVHQLRKALPNGGRNHNCKCTKKGRLIDKGKKVVTA